MGLVEICEHNALLYSEKICKPISKYGDEFPDYFDWSDHIAGKNDSDYQYHLNKMASDVEMLAGIFKPHIDDDKYKDYENWHENWYKQTIAAAWIHDIGMIEDREIHGLLSAQFLFNNNYDFDFTVIKEVNKIKIALLCIKHNRTWFHVYDKMKELLDSYKIPLSKLELFFKDKKPVDDLDFSGKLISTADSLRYRGEDLRNNLGKPFFLWSYCKNCDIFYKQLDSCQCGSKTLNKAVIQHQNLNNDFNPDNYQDIHLYHDIDNKYKRIKGKLPDHPINQNYFASVQDDFQIYTMGDMSLSNVSVQDFASWLNGIKSSQIDYDDLKEYTMLDDNKKEYKTVVEATIDVSNVYAAMFTLAKYIIAYLDTNIATDANFTNAFFFNKAIFHITTSTNERFSKIYEDLDYESCIDIVIPEIQKLKKYFKKWNNSIILPVQVIDNKLEVVEL